MSEKDTGGQAFPSTGTVYNQDREVFEVGCTDSGLTLRDYFATHATENDILELRHRVPGVDQVEDLGGGRKRIVCGAVPDNWRQVARYLHADAMLKARSA